MDDSVDILVRGFEVALRRALRERHLESRQPNSKFLTVGNLIWERGQPIARNCYFRNKAATAASDPATGQGLVGAFSIHGPRLCSPERADESAAFQNAPMLTERALTSHPAKR